MRHLEQVASAALIASTPSVEARTSAAAARFASLADRLFTEARKAYWGLVRRDGFADWFVTATEVHHVGEVFDDLVIQMDRED